MTGVQTCALPILTLQVARLGSLPIGGICIRFFPVTTEYVIPAIAAIAKNMPKTSAIGLPLLVGLRKGELDLELAPLLGRLNIPGFLPLFPLGLFEPPPVLPFLLATSYS